MSQVLPVAGLGEQCSFNEEAWMSKECSEGIRVRSANWASVPISSRLFPIVNSTLHYSTLLYSTLLYSSAPSLQHEAACSGVLYLQSHMSRKIEKKRKERATREHSEKRRG